MEVFYPKWNQNSWFGLKNKLPWLFFMAPGTDEATHKAVIEVSNA